MTGRTSVSLPFYAKAALVSIFIYLIFFVIYLGSSILLPLGFAFLFAVLLRPLEQLLLRWRIPKVLSIMICLIIFIAAVVLLITFVSSQITTLADDLPKIKKSLNGLWDDCQHWLRQTFNISYKKQAEMVNNAKD